MALPDNDAPPSARAPALRRLDAFSYLTAEKTPLYRAIMRVFLVAKDRFALHFDNDMRSKCFGLLEAFDLDFVMTSEREWGCHATVPGLLIYQLTARAGIDAIHTTRFIWDGHERHRDEALAT